MHVPVLAMPAFIGDERTMGYNFCRFVCTADVPALFDTHCANLFVRTALTIHNANGLTDGSPVAQIVKYLNRSSNS